MRPILLKGHERSITSLKYNREGDLIFTASKHPSFAVWYTSNGERLGTYDGHNGAVWSLDVTQNSERVVSGAADSAAKMWQTETGKEISSWAHGAPVRSVDFAVGDQQFLAVTDQFMRLPPSIHVWDSKQKRDKPAIEITKIEGKIQQAVWGPLNKTIIAAHDDGTVRVYDVRNGTQTKVIADHTKAVMQISYNKTQTMFVTASRDSYARLYDSYDFQLLKTYYFGRPANTAAISPLKEEILIGGGQAAESVTTTRAGAAQFRARFYHMVYEEEIGSIQGHFGPVNVVSYSPDGEGFASGGEDGYVRLHYFDKSYLNRRN